jgi:hypothetical protein
MEKSLYVNGEEIFNAVKNGVISRKIIIAYSGRYFQISLAFVERNDAILEA